MSRRWPGALEACNLISLYFVRRLLRRRRNVDGCGFLLRCGLLEALWHGTGWVFQPFVQRCLVVDFLDQLVTFKDLAWNFLTSASYGSSEDGGWY
jgi:hypothetical protein